MVVMNCAYGMFLQVGAVSPDEKTTLASVTNEILSTLLPKGVLAWLQTTNMDKLNTRIRTRRSNHIRNQLFDDVKFSRETINFITCLTG